MPHTRTKRSQSYLEANATKVWVTERARLKAEQQSQEMTEITHRTYRSQMHAASTHPEANAAAPADSCARVGGCESAGAVCGATVRGDDEVGDSALAGAGGALFPPIGASGGGVSDTLSSSTSRSSRPCARNHSKSAAPRGAAPLIRLDHQQQSQHRSSSAVRSPTHNNTYTQGKCIDLAFNCEYFCGQ